MCVFFVVSFWFETRENSERKKKQQHIDINCFFCLNSTFWFLFDSIFFVYLSFWFSPSFLILCLITVFLAVFPFFFFLALLLFIWMRKKKILRKISTEARRVVYEANGGNWRRWNKSFWVVDVCQCMCIVFNQFVRILNK